MLKQHRGILTTGILLMVALLPAGQGAGAGRTALKASTTSDAPYDLIIEGGRIVDGTGNPWYFGDLAVSGDTIAQMGPRGSLREAVARERIDARGLVVAPGFIDFLSTSDRVFLLGDGRSISKLTQGITTEILGEGWNDAPVSELTLAAAEQLEISGKAAQQALRQFMGPNGFGRWLNALQRHGISPNVGSFLGAMTLRAYAMGMAMRVPTAAEQEIMHEVMRQAMRDGAFGLGTALIYPPGSYASTNELIDICRVMAPYGGVYSTHIRSEGDRLLESLDEAIQIGQAANVPVEIYHLKAAGRGNWAKERSAIEKINTARAAGLDVQANMYPYEAGGTTLAACLPPWASANGKLIENLRDPTTRQRIAADEAAKPVDWENVCQLATPAGVIIYGFKKPATVPYQGKSLEQIAAARHERWTDTLMDLFLLEDGQPNAMFFLSSEENVRAELRQPWIQFATDASGEAPSDANTVTHPRAYGTFPRILGYYVRDEKILSLEDAVRKMTSAVATRLSIKSRGLLREGFFADITVFSPTEINDRATYARPNQLAVGVHYVLVNGQMVVRNGRHTGAKPGRVVRGPGFASYHNRSAGRFELHPEP